MRAKLKAGFVLTSSSGPATMLRYAGKGVGCTGSAPICVDERGEAFLRGFDDRGEPRAPGRLDGAITEIASFPRGQRVRSIAWHNDRIFADGDGRIHRIEVVSGDVTELTSSRFLLGGSLRIAGDVAAWHDGTDVVATDLSTGAAVWRRTVAAAMWEPHTPI